MNDTERIDFIKQEWKKFLKKQIKKDIEVLSLFPDEALVKLKKILDKAGK
jgi:hypothetical protein